MSIEKMRLALEALEEINKYSKPPNGICLPAEIDTAMDALRQEIAQAEKQEPMPDDLILMYEKGWGDCETKLAEKQEQFCDNHCTWRDHHSDCVRAEKQGEHK
jgi:hypothetical protein